MLFGRAPQACTHSGHHGASKGREVVRALVGARDISCVTLQSDFVVPKEASNPSGAKQQVLGHIGGNLPHDAQAGQAKASNAVINHLKPGQGQGRLVCTLNQMKLVHAACLLGNGGRPSGACIVYF